LIVIDPQGQARNYEELPVDYVRDSDFGEAECYVTITLEYGPDRDKFDPFDITVKRAAQDDADHSFDAHYLHPVVRQYSRRTFVSEHHIAENLENQWNGSALVVTVDSPVFGRRDGTCATATRLFICGLPPCCVNWPWHGPMEACATSWLDWAVSMFWSLMTGPWRR
jgi:hypothetical protein